MSELIFRRIRSLAREIDFLDLEKVKGKKQVLGSVYLGSMAVHNGMPCASATMT